MSRLLEVGWVDIEMLCAVVGFWMWEAFLRRELMSLPAGTFEMLEKRPGKVVKWWAAARREFAAMRNLIPMM
eukprot:2139459-Pyramimonas_sp.AAC.1